MAQAHPPRVTVVVAARSAPPTLAEALASLAAQPRAGEIEVLVADGSDDASVTDLVARYPNMRRLPVPGGNLPTLKAAAIREARGDLVAVLDPGDAAEPGWIDEMLAAFAEPGVSAVGGSVLLAHPGGAANVAAYLFEYGAFNPPIAAGDTAGDLPGNNVAYRRAGVAEACADILATVGFYKPFVHERLRANGGRIVVRPAMRVRHLTSYSFLAFGVRRFHYGRCFGALRVERAAFASKVAYRVFAPLVAPLLVVRHLVRAAGHASNRRLLPGAALALCGVCTFWGVGEWLGYWFGPGRSCAEVA